MTWPLIGALGVNILVLVPVISGLMAAAPGVDVPFGPATPARGILMSVYISIMLVSAALILAHWQGAPWAVPATLALFAVQIVYKATTVAVIGLGNPVVLTNTAVIAIQLAAVTLWWRG
ncbi:MAG: hypothetical protein AAF218_05780 [Pseudomonadota bacterium]